jgi:hypothetical protein
MNYKPIITRKVMIFDLQKPIYGSTYAIWDKWLQIARRKNLKIVVNTQFGTATFESVGEYLREAKKIERYYKNPNEPMIFWQLDFLPFIREREKRKKLEQKTTATNGEYLLKAIQKIRERQPDLFERVKSQII